MPHELFIVARDRPDLYRFLAETFADADTVQVIWDRRVAERRAAGRAPGADARGADRRVRTHIDDEIRASGYAFISLGEPSSPIAR